MLPAELELEAASRLPSPVLDYIRGGAADERTLAENGRAWRALGRGRIRARPGLAARDVDCSLELLGHRLGAPILLAPVAALRLVHPDGELAAAHAAGAARTIFCLSTRATADLAEVAAAGDGPLWFSLYVDRDRELAGRIVRRAVSCGFERVVLTADLPVAGRRERELRHGVLAMPPGVTITTHLGRPGETTHKPPAGGWDAGVTWGDLAWLTECAGRPPIVKGILTAADARLALEHGAEAVVVSNHGGRQLDGVLPTAVALAEVAAAAGGLPVLVDGGLRCGADIFVALALGASAVMIGRPYVCALAARGASGVLELLDWLAADLRRVMALAGCATLDDIGRHCLAGATARPPENSPKMRDAVRPAV